MAKMIDPMGVRHVKDVADKTLALAEETAKILEDIRQHSRQQTELLTQIRNILRDATEPDPDPSPPPREDQA